MIALGIPPEQEYVMDHFGSNIGGNLGLLTAAMVLLLGCPASTGPSTRSTGGEGTAAPTGEEGVIQQERVDEIMRVCNRKAGSVIPVCWSEEYQRTGKKFEAQITLMIVVGPNGRAEETKIVSTNAQSKPLLDCVVDQAKSWTFPEGKSSAPVNCSFYLKSSM